MSPLLARRGRWLWSAERRPGRLEVDWAAALEQTLGQGWTLARSAHGAPEFRHPLGYWLSRSHAAGIDVLLLSRRGPVGVDVEARCRPLSQAVLGRLLGPAERAWRDPERPELGVLAWCAKEALTKALGRGIAYGLHRLVLGPPPAARFGLIRLRLGDADGPAAAWRWRIVAHLGQERVLVAAEGCALEVGRRSPTCPV
ncbi:MAG: 4'-phosphopantetheinyl transferase superfamily protein [Xanthomonadales bacterium]|nr:4'-phosphopantetheinyl transferase superfamily protein [Xanthomonadales bacterium]